MANVTIVLKNKTVQSVYSSDPETHVIVIGEFGERSAQEHKVYPYSIAPQKVLNMLPKPKESGYEYGFADYCRSISWGVSNDAKIRPDLTESQCREVLDEAIDAHDADVGVTREVIKQVAGRLFPKDGKEGV